MIEIINEHPKTVEKYRKWLKKNYQDDYGKENFPEITDNMIAKVIDKSPMSLTRFFDSLELIGTINYDYMEGIFQLYLNGMAIEDEDPDNESVIMGDTDRLEAERKLIKYLFIEAEKTL